MAGISVGGCADAKGLKPTNKSATPVFRNMLLEDVRCAKGANSFFIDGLAEQHILNLTLRKCSRSLCVGPSEPKEEAAAQGT